LKDFKGMSREDVLASVRDAQLNPLQFNKLFDASQSSNELLDASGAVSVASLDALASELSRINLSNSDGVLALSARLQACGVTCLKDFKGMSREDVLASVRDAQLTPLQFNKLFGAVPQL
jgi:hypothetical protein